MRVRRPDPKEKNKEKKEKKIAKDQFTKIIQILLLF